MMPAQGELGHMQLAEQDGSGGRKLFDYGAILRRRPGAEHLGATGRGNVLGATQILHGHRYPMQRSAIATTDNVRFRRAGLRQGLLTQDRDITVETRVEPRDTVEQMARQFDGGQVTGLDTLGHRGQRGQGQIGHTVCTS